MSEHVLLKFAKKRPYADTPGLPSDARYDIPSGRWFTGDTPMVTGSRFEQVTKKCDQETGEDQKGE
jgi:hypothetical protein